MPEYTPILAVYVFLQFLSIALMLFLLVILFRHRTSLTLVGLCMSAVILSITELLTVLPFGSGVRNMGGRPLCIAQAYLEDFAHNAASFWALCLAFNLWVVVGRRLKKTERQMWPFYALFSWGMPIILEIVAFAMSARKPSAGTFGGPAFCVVGDSVRVPTVMLPSSVSTGIGMVHDNRSSSSTIFYQIFIALKRRGFWTKWQNAIKEKVFDDTVGASFVEAELNVFFLYSLCIRMLTFCIVYGLVSTLANIDKLSNWVADPSRDMVQSKDPGLDEFSGTLVGTGLFIIFGTTTEALQMVFPCYKGGSLFRAKRNEQYSDIEMRSPTATQFSLSSVVKPHNNTVESFSMHPLNSQPTMHEEFEFRAGEHGKSYNL
ncbi:uncharacterized protein VTP21DRAFT_3942 [Calcarisporiella thermophila]|uniref:uncharacterized protein n=1 Tax=Calcarisporiella thermophila TaxID=911321 RepID=UPI003744B059